MYTHEIADMLFFIKNFTSSFNISILAHHNLPKYTNYKHSYAANISRHFRTLTEFLVCGIHYW